MILTIMSYNIQHGINHIKMFHDETTTIDLLPIAKIIKKANPDFVCLNEVYNGGIYGDQLKQIAKLACFPYYYFGKSIDVNGASFGNGILSKFPFKSETIEIFNDNINQEKRSIIKSTLDNMNLDIYCTHLGLTSKERLDGINAFLNMLDEKENMNIILMGDFNATPESDEIRLIKTKMIDIDANDKETYPSLMPKEKIDYIFKTKNITTMDEEVLDEVYSDHLPIIATVKFNEK